MIKQLSFATFDANFAMLDKIHPQLLQLLEDFIDITELIPFTWSLNYYKDTGRPHVYPLPAIVSALLLQKFLSISTVELLITFLNFSEDLRNFCGLRTVPDPSFFSRFKQEYADDIEAFFHMLVDITEPICQELGESLTKELGVNPAKVYIMDTTGIECFVKENNPKFFNSLVKKLQYLNKDKPKEEIYKLAYSQMPKSASADSNIKLQYINGTFCYAHKTVVMSNALGILRHIDFCDHMPDCSAPELPPVPDNPQASGLPSPEEIKVHWDGKLLKPAMENFFKLHPSFPITALTADSGFDAILNYDYLFTERQILPIIKLNPRSSNDFGIPGINADGVPTCPKDPSMPMVWDGSCQAKDRPQSMRIKFICPKTKKIRGGKYQCSCESPCTTSSCGRMFYTYPKDNFRAHTPIPRGTPEWDKYADFRPIIEQVISRLKLPLQLGRILVRDRKTTKADLFMAGAAHLVTVLLAYRMGATDKIRSTKSIA
ncbi:MAG: transposase [Bacillota bacterium]|jgi:hypothetical protein